MDQETQNLIEAIVTPIAMTAVAFGVTAAAAVIASNVIVPTNMSSSGLTGDVNMHPTVQETNISESNVAVNSTEGKVSHDQVNARQGEVKASTMDATAQDSEATANEAGASAVRTKAGASDIEAKALKMT